MSSRGQTFLPDYMASILVFGIILTIFLSSWNSVLSDQTEFSEADQMRQTARQTATFLVTTPGYPENWEEDDVEVQIPGFVEADQTVQEEKLDAFRNLSYMRQKELLTAQDYYMKFKVDEEESEGGVGEQPVAYVTWSNADFSRLRVPQALNRSDVQWDIYWPSGNDLERLEALNVRNVYTYSDRSEVMMEDVIENASDGDYRSIVSENSNVDPGDISNDDELRTWVENGGSLIHSEEYKTLVKDVFNLQESSDTNSEGTVVETGPLLNDSYSVSDSVEFDDDPAAFENPDRVFVEDDSSPNGCLACRWDIGSGKLYYIQDTFSDVDDYSTTFKNGENAFSSNIFIGKEPSGEAEKVVPVTRTVALNISENITNAEMKYVVWR